MDQTKKSTSEKAVKWLADRGIVNHIDDRSHSDKAG